MTKEQATAFFAELFCGEHRIPRGGVQPFGLGWCVNTWVDLSTFDQDKLTRLVFLAHDRCVRAEITHSGPRMVRICIWQRIREGGITDRHPTLEQAVSAWRARHPAPVEFDTGDVVKHSPTGEEWIVAFVDDPYLAWCGWPSGRALISDCTLVRKATPAERIALLRQLAQSWHTGADRARAALDAQGIPLQAPTVAA